MPEPTSETSGAPSLQRYPRRPRPAPMPSLDRLPPHSPESEQGVLGAILLDPNMALPLCAEKFKGEGRRVFYDLRHQTIYDTILELVEDGVAVDVITLQERLKCWGKLEQVGGFSYLSTLPEIVPSAYNAPDYIGIVWDKYLLRRMISACTETVGCLYDYEGDVSEIMQQAETAVLNVRRMRVEEAIFGMPIGDVQPPMDPDPTEIIRYRYLCQGAGLLFVGPTGVGKSSFLIQAAALWANGMDMFGSVPSRCLRTLIVQAENDAGDVAQMRDGICTGLGFTEEQRHQFFQNVFIYTSRGLTGRRFCQEELARLLDTHSPLDLLMLDPLFAYVGCDISNQAGVTDFLRVQLNPLMFDHHCSPFLSHHENKPLRGKDKVQQTIGEMAYSGSGANELANWPRAVMVLKGTADPGIYSLVAAKRGIRLGWRNGDDVTPIYEKPVAHSKQQGLIYWRTPDADELPSDDSSSGRPPVYDRQEWLSLIPSGGITPEEFRKQSKSQLGIPERTYWRMLANAKSDGLIFKSHITKRWMRQEHVQPPPPPQIPD